MNNSLLYDAQQQPYYLQEQLFSFETFERLIMQEEKNDDNFNYIKDNIFMLKFINGERRFLSLHSLD